MRGLPLHHSQKEYEVNKDAIIFEYYLKPTFDLKKELLSMGAEIEVVDPEWFREEMKNIVEDINKI